MAAASCVGLPDGRPGRYDGSARTLLMPRWRAGRPRACWCRSARNWPAACRPRGHRPRSPPGRMAATCWPATRNHREKRGRCDGRLSRGCRGRFGTGARDRLHRCILMDGSPPAGQASSMPPLRRHHPAGMGLTAALLARSGIRVWSHRDLALLVAAGRRDRKDALSFNTHLDCPLARPCGCVRMSF